MAVAGELRQILANLLANSLDAIDPGGRIVLRASVSIDPLNASHRVRITVADAGCGMVPATTRRIFEPFFTTKGTVGTGLGLWVSRQLIEKNIGSIKVRSNPHGPHQGTTFSILLPRHIATH
jgi:signal transduction histidine kinase